MTVYLVVYQQMLDQMDITLSCNLHLSNSDSTRTCRIPCRVRVHCKHSGTPTPSAAPAVQEEAQAKLFLAYSRITNGFVLTTYINFTLHLCQLQSIVPKLLLLRPHGSKIRCFSRFSRSFSDR